MAFPEYLAVRGIQFRSHSRQEEIRLRCPFCSEQRFRLGLNWVDNVGHCFNCGWKSRRAIQAVMRALGIRLTAEDERVLIRSRYRKSGEDEAGGPKPVRLPKDFVTLPAITEDDGPPFTLALRYWLERGFTVEEARLHRIGASFTGTYAYRIIMPVVWQGRLASFLARSFAGREPRYLNSPGTRYIWNLESRQERIVMAEGVFKALALAKTFPLLHCTAALGHSLSSEQLDQLEACGVQSVILWPDPDPDGLLGALSMADSLASRGIEVEIPRTVPVHQADETASSALRRLLVSCEPITRDVSMLYRLEAGRRK